MKVVVISHSAVVTLYREKFHQMASQGLEIHLILPPKWLEGNRWVEAPTSGMEQGVMIHQLKAGFLGHVGGFYLKGLAKLIKKIKPDLIHIEEEPYSMIAWQVKQLNQQLHLPWVFFTWENIFRSYRWPLSKIDKSILKKCFYAIVGNVEAAQVLQQRGFLGQATVIPQYGVDPEVFKKATCSQPQGNQRMKLIYCGRLLKEKGIDFLLEALKTVKGDWELTILGNGPFKTVLEELIAKLGLQNQVAFQAAVNNAEMPNVLNQFDLLILPSITTKDWKEQFGRVLIEAMACEVAVIGSSSGEIPHVIGDQALVFPEKNSRALSEKIQQLMQDEKLRLAKAKQGRQRVLDHFTTGRIVTETIAVYQKMLDNRTA